LKLEDETETYAPKAVAVKGNFRRLEIAVDGRTGSTSGRSSATHRSGKLSTA